MAEKKEHTNRADCFVLIDPFVPFFFPDNNSLAYSYNDRISSPFGAAIVCGSHKDPFTNVQPDMRGIKKKKGIKYIFFNQAAREELLSDPRRLELLCWSNGSGDA